MKALWKGTLVGGLSGLLFGFDTAVIAETRQGLTRAFGLDPAELGRTVSSALLGTLLGALFADRPGDQYGACNCLRAIAAMYVVSAIGCCLSVQLNSNANSIVKNSSYSTASGTFSIPRSSTAVLVE
jgi:MFS family permease